MNRKLSSILLIGTTVLATQTAQAAPPSAQQPDEAGAAPKPTVVDGQLPEIDRASLTPMHQEIYDAIASERASVEALNLRYSRAALLGDRLAIQREIEAVKRTGMIQVLQIQIRYARTEGRTEVAAQLEKCVEEVRNPKSLQGSGERLIDRQ